MKGNWTIPEDVDKTVKLGKPILPLIVLGREMFLVDGYARYRALKSLGVEKVMVVRQVFDN